MLPTALALVRGTGLVDVEQRDFRASRGKGPGGRKSDRACRAGDGDDLPRQRQFPGAAELGLFQRPIFDIEQVGLAAADRNGRSLPHR